MSGGGGGGGAHFLMAASSISLPTATAFRQRHLRPTAFRFSSIIPCAKFDLSELLGGRGLCNGEQGVQLELRKSPAATTPAAESEGPPSPPPSAVDLDFDFEKELLGLTGGFPGGEKGLRLFLRNNPPPQPASSSGAGGVVVQKKPGAPELPLLMPGMMVIVNNPRNPFYMYAGIVQRVTDGKAGVLFEGGNWDKLLTFDLHELHRRDKGPPMVNPKSAVIELDSDRPSLLE